MFIDRIIERRDQRLLSLKNQAMNETGMLASELRKKFKFERLYLYGSLAEGAFTFHSDIDFVIKGLKPEDFFSAHALLLRLSSFSVDLKPWEELDDAHKKKIEKYGIEI